MSNLGEPLLEFNIYPRLVLLVAHLTNQFIFFLLFELPLNSNLLQIFRHQRFLHTNVFLHVIQCDDKVFLAQLQITAQNSLEEAPNAPRLEPTLYRYHRL